MVVYFILISLVSLPYSLENEKIPIKIVNEYSKGEDFGPNLGFHEDIGVNELSFDHDTKESKIKTNPSTFSGPQQFKALMGLCFPYLDDKYKFKFCPFQNVTQEEVTATYEPFKGVLGVWGEWVIVNNSFKAMQFLGGAKCGSGSDRRVKVLIKCGDAHHLTKMFEPLKCIYEGEFYTPLACGKNALVVYPRLPTSLQEEWDRIETQKHFDILTQKGYDEELKRLFMKAGFYLSDKQKESLSDQNQGSPDSSCEAVKILLENRIREFEKKILEQEEIIKSLQHLKKS
ncbi:UNVERIFIED_CONTAM: hypothetical protein RMT77_013490 [Armadillidium vulgare]